MWPSRLKSFWLRTMRVLLLLHWALLSEQLRVGHLQARPKERKILEACLKKHGETSMRIITLAACQNLNGVENAAALHHSFSVDAFIGATCPDGLLGFTASSYDAVEKLHGERARERAVGLGSALHSLCIQLQCEKAGLIYSSEYSAEAAQVMESFVATELFSERIEEASNIINSARVFFFLVPLSRFFSLFANEIFPSPTEYSLFFVDFTTGSRREFFRRLTVEVEQAKLPLKDAASLLRSTLLIKFAHSDKYAVEQFAFEYNIQMNEDLESSLLLCDALILLRSVSSFTVPLNGTGISRLHSLLTDRTTDGYSGRIFIDSAGRRHPFFEIYAYSLTTPNQIGALDVESCTDSLLSNCVNGTLYRYILHANSSYLWDLPPPLPACGMDGSGCSNTHIIIISSCVCAIVAAPLLLAWYLQRKEYELQRMPWRVQHELMQPTEEESRRYSSTNVSMRSASFMYFSPFDCQRAHYQGEKITMKSFIQKRAISFTRGEMETLNQLKNLNHANVNRFIGISFNQNSEMTVCWSHCSRGSLESILFKNDHSLGRNFRSTFLRHIMKGLTYIHCSPIKCHGALFLSNCVVDTYWVVKLTDFGLHKILNDKLSRKELFRYPVFEFRDLPQKWLQVAPELLREMERSNERTPGSVSGDVYQMGMLIYQILFNLIPFAERQETTAELMKLLLSMDTAAGVKPRVPEDTGITMRLLSIMQQCWLTKESLRPALAKIGDALQREFGNDSKGSLVDQMIKMIDEYSANLETIVAKRTTEIAELNDKNEALLYQMLPRSIAMDLREGRAVRPSMHSSVSLLFIDICQFTVICEQSIPADIITMLNALYSRFDEIVQKHNAWKVENVGDAYLVVSGIPDCEDNECDHLLHVCLMALQIQKFVEEDFRVDHRPDFHLQVKAGIHSGALASGILGSSAPRFCVFGDTVNMASRMASTSLAGRTQMTETAQALLIRHYPLRFTIEERGIVDIKGKGPSTTFWLIQQRISIKK